MSVERPARGLIVFVCNVCGDTIDVTSDDADLSEFREVWDFAKSAGWRLKRGEHYCSGCAKLD